MSGKLQNTEQYQFPVPAAWKLISLIFQECYFWRALFYPECLKLTQDLWLLEVGTNKERAEPAVLQLQWWLFFHSWKNFEIQEKKSQM